MSLHLIKVHRQPKHSIINHEHTQSEMEQILALKNSFAGCWIV